MNGTDKSGRRKYRLLRRRQTFLCALLFIGVTLWLGAVRRPYGEINSMPTAAPSRASLASAGRFRVGTFNMHGGGKEIGSEDLALTARVIQGLDLLGLNEVRGPSSLRWCNQAECLGAKLGMAAVFGPSERRWFVGSFGNGLLSRFVIRSWRSQPMQVHGKKSYRALITAQVEIGEANVTVVVAHVERGSARDSQLGEVYHHFARAGAPAILLGDFNAHATHIELQRIASLPGVVYPLKAYADLTRGVDHIFVKGLRVIDAGYIPNEASDHPLVWTDLEYPPGE